MIMEPEDEDMKLKNYKRTKRNFGDKTTETTTAYCDLDLKETVGSEN